MLIRQSAPDIRSMAVGGRPAQRTGGDSLRSVLARRWGATRGRTHGPWWPVFIVLFGVVGCSLSIGGVLLVARQGPPPPQQSALAEWGRACRLGLEPDESLQPLADDVTPYQASVPGSGKYQAEHALSTAGSITLADLMLAAGQPQAGCLDYGLLRREPVIWVRLVLADGQVEAYSALPSRSQRLSPDAPVYALFCYRSGANDPPVQNESWRGFASLAFYRDCPHGGTAVPR